VFNLKTREIETYKIKYTSIHNEDKKILDAITKKHKLPDPMWINMNQWDLKEDDKKTFEESKADDVWRIYDGTVVTVKKQGEKEPVEVRLPNNMKKMSNLLIMVKKLWKLPKKTRVGLYYPPRDYKGDYEWNLY
jgi:hypothetical protein